MTAAPCPCCGRPTAPARLERGPLVMDPLTREATWADAPVALTHGQWRALWALARWPGAALSRDRLLDALDDQGMCADRCIDTLVKRLRARLRAAGAGEPIRTIYGVGYTLTVERDR